MIVNLTHQELDACLSAGHTIVVSRRRDANKGEVVLIILMSNPVEYEIAWEDGQSETLTRAEFVIEHFR